MSSHDDLLYVLHNSINSDWKDLLVKCYEKHGNGIEETFVEHEKLYVDILEIFPQKSMVFNAFTHFNIDDTKALAVILFIIHNYLKSEKYLRIIFIL